MTLLRSMWIPVGLWLTAAAVASASGGHPVPAPLTGAASSGLVRTHVQIPGLEGSVAVPLGLAMTGSLARPWQAWAAPFMWIGEVSKLASTEVLAQLATSGASIPEEEEKMGATDLGDDPLAEVRWTVTREGTADAVAARWGLQTKALRALNPGLASTGIVAPGTELVVYRHDPAHPTQSIGAPNQGRLRSGIPLPEGKHWRLRDHRPRAFGSRLAVTALVEAMERYGAENPDASPLRIGELSRRTGGKIAPHVSHRTGRDVDIGYVLKPEFEDEEHYWRRVTERSLDAARTWSLLKSLLATGQVQSVYMGSSVQRLVAREAAKELTPEQLAELFEVHNRDHTRHTVVSHEHGHRDHLHVRFACTPGNARCRARSIERG